jgi:Flp pilus assembly protein TadG
MMPLLILMIGAIIMVALGLHTRSNLQQAVREGARQAAVGKSLTDVQGLAAGNSGGTLDAADINWCLPSGSTGTVGDQIRVYVDEGNNGSEGYGYTIIPATGIFSAMGVNSLTVNMSPRATARLEKSVSGIPACT